MGTGTPFSSNSRSSMVCRVSLKLPISAVVQPSSLTTHRISLLSLCFHHCTRPQVIRSPHVTFLGNPLLKGSFITCASKYKKHRHTCGFRSQRVPPTRDVAL